MQMAGPFPGEHDIEQVFCSGRRGRKPEQARRVAGVPAHPSRAHPPEASLRTPVAGLCRRLEASQLQVGALVVHQDETLEGSPLAWKWFPVEQLRPMYPDPNPRTELNY